MTSNPYTRPIVDALVAKATPNHAYPGLVDIVAEELTAFWEAYEAAAMFGSTPAELRNYAKGIRKAADRLVRAMEAKEPQGPAKLMQLLIHHGLAKKHGIGVFAQAEALNPKAVDALMDADEAPHQMVAIAKALELLHAVASHAEIDRGPQYRADFHGGGETAINEWVTALIKLYERITLRPASISKDLGEYGGPLCRFVCNAVRIGIGARAPADSLLAKRINHVIEDFKKARQSPPLVAISETQAVTMRQFSTIPKLAEK